MRAFVIAWTLPVAVASHQADAPMRALSDQQIREAIEIGRAGKVSVVQVGTILGASKGDFDVFIEGPIARIAAAASSAFRQYRPFDATNVTAEMKEPVYRVIFKRDFERYRNSGRPKWAAVHEETAASSSAWALITKDQSSSFNSRFSRNELGNFIARLILASISGRSSGSRARPPSSGFASIMGTASLYETGSILLARAATKAGDFLLLSASRNRYTEAKSRSIWEEFDQGLKKREPPRPLRQ